MTEPSYAWRVARPEAEPFVLEGSFDPYRATFEAEIFDPLPVSAEAIQLNWRGVGGGWGVVAVAYTNHRRQPRLALVPTDLNGLPFSPKMSWVQSKQLRLTSPYQTRNGATPHAVEAVATLTVVGLILRVGAADGTPWHPSEPKFYQQQPWKTEEA
jgi:hypothetical protein